MLRPSRFLSRVIASSPPTFSLCLHPTPFNLLHRLQSCVSQTHLIMSLPCWKILSGSPSSLVGCLSRALTTGLQSVFLDSSSSSLPFPSCTLATLDYSPSPDMPFLFTSRCLLYPCPLPPPLPPSVHLPYLPDTLPLRLGQLPPFTLNPLWTNLRVQAPFSVLR